MYKAYNDYELLYLANEYDDMVALSILVRKYKNFIYKKAISFFPNDSNLEDYYQEGLLCLLRSIKTFDDDYNKTFMRYFEVLLNRHLINIYHKNKREHEKLLMIINEAYVDEQFYEAPQETKASININFGSNAENIIYQYYFLEGMKIDYISKKLNLTKKQVYNAIYRVKRKIKEKEEKFTK